MTCNFGRRLLEPIRKMFALTHRKDQMDRSRYKKTLVKIRDIIIGLIRRAPDRHESQKIKKRFQNHSRSYFTFMNHDGVVEIEPTNNATERQIRFVVLDRKVTQGTKGLIGNLWCERIWSTVATCRQRSKPIFEFLLDTFNAHLQGKLTPSLVYV